VPGLGLAAIMLMPIVAATLLFVPLRYRIDAASPLRGLWLIAVVVLGTALAMRLQSAEAGSDPVINRALAILVIAACAGFAWANRHQTSGLVRTGVWLSVLGAGANALATAIYGYMPVLASSARWLGWEVGAGDHPDPQYVAVHASQLPALLLGDILPVPGLEVVASIGDLLLIPGFTILLAAVFAGLFPAPRPDLCTSDQGGR